MSTGTLLEARVGYRNFNLYPHCVLQGQQAILCRLCEGIPMIPVRMANSFTFSWPIAQFPIRQSRNLKHLRSFRPVSDIHMFCS